jgi:DNA-binding LytR/AlgR family response regulator
MALAGILAAIPGTIEIIALHSWLVRPTPLRAALAIYPQTAFLTVAISVVIGLFIERRLHADADSERARVADLPAADVPKDIAPDFFRRVPPALGRDLLALEMEDHYLRIHTALGSDLILLRLRDALAELGPSRGRQVHRSWWVAEGAIASAEGNARRPMLVLRNGLRVPVSKTFRDQVKQAGWLG